MENDNFSQNNNDPYGNPYQSQPEYQTPPPQSQPNQSFGMATASLILGIVCLITTCCFYICIPLGALSIILAILSRGSTEKISSQGKTGIGLSIGGICLTILLTIAVFFIQLGSDTFRSQMQEYMDYYYGRDAYDSDDLDDWLDDLEDYQGNYEDYYRDYDQTPSRNLPGGSV